MRSIGAAALLFALAIATECFAAQSDRSRQRSGPIRSVPVGADIKRDADFDCPEEFGYYPHPTDCTLYYVCVFGGALLESCTGGLMYSHELQTCDWPRNVGCDGTSVGGGEELERLSEREPPPPPPPRRTPPPPPPRAQLNPVVTSRGQPKFNREEYEKQLYAEVDDLPPVEEIESDRQQRVHRGQPPTIGQVQKDRDGYASQVVSSGRNFNSNIIPASISQNSGKIGSFSFGTQVEDRRAAVTQAPQRYSERKSDNVTDSHHDRQLDIETNEIDVNDVTQKPVLRKKRDVLEQDLGGDKNNTNSTDGLKKRNDADEEMEYFEFDMEPSQDDDDSNDELNIDESERGKRQVRYYLKNGFKSGGKNWANSKPIKFVDLQQFNYNPNVQNTRYHQTFNGLNNNNFYEATRSPHVSQNLLSTANPFILYQTENSHSQRPFKPSLPDPSKQKILHSPINPSTQIITKSPPISSLKNNENPFSALAGGFFKNGRQPSNQISSQTINHPYNRVPFQDSSLLPSTVVTGTPVPTPTSQRNHNKYRIDPQQQSQKNFNDNKNAQKRPSKDADYEDDDDEKNDESSEEVADDDEEDDNSPFKYDFPELPYEYTHPKNKFANIDNPFARPDFDFDAFLAKLRDDHYDTVGITTPKPKNYYKNAALKTIIPSVEVTTASNTNSGTRSSTLNYKGMSTPKPFTPYASSNLKHIQNNLNLQTTTNWPDQFERLVQRPQPQNQQYYGQQGPLNKNIFIGQSQQSTGTLLDAVRPKLKPPNFSDDRQLPINYNFNRPVDTTANPNNHETQLKGETTKIFTVTQKPHIMFTSTGAPIILSTPKQQYIVKGENILFLQPHLATTGKPYLVSTFKPHNAYIAFKQSTPKPLTTIANEQLSTLQHYWRHPSQYTIRPSVKPSAVSEIPTLESLFEQPIRTSVQIPVKNQNVFANTAKYPITTTTKAPPKRRPIPKPSPEMNDYYYDDDNEYYEPPVKSQYMPSSEVRPQRPPMAQNYQEYEDYEDINSLKNAKYQRPTSIRPLKYTAYKPETATKNLNDVSVVTKGPLKDSNKNTNLKIPVPVMVTPSSNVLIRPEVSKYEIIHNIPRNKTVHFRKPTAFQSGPSTIKPPKYLNKTTLRPYTVRHRLAKPTTVKESANESEENKQTRGRIRHHNIVAQMKFTTPRDSHNQETRYTKTKHDDKTNSLEPTESVSPASYSASPRPKMLYNGSQSYTPEQYDPYYPVYDEDSELYKDTDYVQQYNVASLRPAVQQTYRGTPPPARRPVETYTPRPSPDDYDDALIQGQINNQNQYQAPVRHSTRGEGNELGYDHNPSSVRTAIYEATSLRTTPSTTSTSTTTTTTTTTTQRSTTAPFTEAVTPFRHTPRSSTDETSKNSPESSSPHSRSDGSLSSIPSTPSSISLSSLAKPFEKTDNSHRLRESLSSTEKLPTTRLYSHLTNKNNLPVEVVRQTSNRDNKTVVSLTTGFSIRRNSNNTNNPYTLTVLTRPFDNYEKSRKSNNSEKNNNKKEQSSRYYYDTEDSHVSSKKPSESSERRNDARPEIVIDEEDVPVYVRSGRINSIRTKTTISPKIKLTTSPTTTDTTKYYLKTVIKRPASFSANDEQTEASTENTVDTEAIIDAGLQNARTNGLFSSSRSKNALEIEQYDKSEETVDEPVVSPYSTLNNLRKISIKDDLLPDYTTSTTSTAQFVPTVKDIKNIITEKSPTSKPSYYSYRLVDEADLPDQTTEILNGRVKNVIKAFFGNFVSTPKPERIVEIPTTSPKPLSPPEEKIVNIGFTKKMLKYVDETPFRNNVKRLQIITEATVDRFRFPVVDGYKKVDSEVKQGFSSTTTTTSTSTTVIPLSYDIQETSSILPDYSTSKDYKVFPSREPHQSKFNAFMTNKPEYESPRKFIKFLDELSSTPRNHRDEISFNNEDNELTKLTKTDVEINKTLTEIEQPITELINDIASTTSTTKATTTVRAKPSTTTKSISFPTRASRVNPAIKLAATNLGGGRRSYQSSSKCSSDNSLQANPKCNEIKYQRPSTPTRGRGSAHYSTLSGSDAPQQTPNRGTPPTRSRPTLKPSTAIVSKSTEFVDIYAHPPSRPAPVYPQPTPDKTAAKCRKDVCLLPDCYCGGKDIPGNLAVSDVPQMVLMTFDDAVNDLNKMYYEELFEKGRVNPNGCPISATFYVSHEWTDYSQVQNLYADGHEFASHTISHSFGEQFSQKKWNREVGGQREILSAYGGVKLEDVRGMRAPFLSVGGNKMFKMLYDSNFTYDSSLPVYENRPPSWPYTLDYKLFHDCMIPPCPTKSYPGVWEVPMVMWQDLNGGRCSMGDACANPPDAEGVYKMLLKNFDRHYTTNRAPFGLFYHAAWFTHLHHKEGFIMFLDFINSMKDVWIVTNWQALQWVRDPTPINRLNNFQPFQCNYADRPKKCNNPKVCNLWHKSGVRYMRTCQPCPEVFPWTGKTGIRSSRIDNDIEE